MEERYLKRFWGEEIAESIDKPYGREKLQAAVEKKRMN
jgi:hypothetical protein